MTTARLEDVPLLAQSARLPVPRVRTALLAWYQAHRRPLPWRELWRAEANPYHVWLSEIMLQQTVIKAVIPIYASFLARYPTVQSLARASESDIKKTVAGLGYYRRFRMLHQAAQLLVQGVGDAQVIAWPKDYAGWLALPGVGAYTAAAVSSIAFGSPHAVVDGNVERVLCRLFDIRLAPNLPALKKIFQTICQELVDPSEPGDFNQAMMELGQTVCTVGSPLCTLCPLKAHCQAFANASTALAPAAKIKTAKCDIRLHMMIVRKGERYALFERARTAKFLKETPGFLTALPTGRKSAKSRWVVDGQPSCRLSVCEPIGKIRHGITKHRIVAEVSEGNLDCLDTTGQLGPMRWYKREELGGHLISSLDRKAWQLYRNSLLLHGSVFD